MAIYQTRRSVRPITIVACLFPTLAALYLYIASGEVHMLAATAAFVALTLMVALISLPEIITDNTGIIKKKQGRVYQNCQWDWIYDAMTYRAGAGTYTTLLSYSQNPEKRSDKGGWIIRRDPVGGILAISADFNDYTTLLKEIREKAANAQFDETTEKIIRDGIQISTARKIFWIGAALFFTATLIYLVMAFSS